MSSLSCTDIPRCLAQIALAAVGSLALIGRAIVSGSAESSSELSKNAAKKKRKRANAKEKSESVEEPAVSAKVSSKLPQSNGKQQPQPGQPVQSAPSMIDEKKDDVPIKKRTAAERKAGKTRKTKVDDMLSEPQGPSYARVMKITDPDKEPRQPAVIPQPEPEIEDEAPTFAEVVEKEPVWEEVPKKAKSISISRLELVMAAIRSLLPTPILQRTLQLPHMPLRLLQQHLSGLYQVLALNRIRNQDRTQLDHKLPKISNSKPK